MQKIEQTSRQTGIGRHMAMVGNQYAKHMNMKMTFKKTLEIEQMSLARPTIGSYIPYPTKKNFNPIIPLNIFQTWHTKLLPPSMMKAVATIKASNPRFQYYLFDDNECREFIKNNFEPNVLHAFDTLIPGAYKADLWRYCILYKKGGIYLDIKYIPYHGFKFIYLTEKEHFVLDANQIGIYNALIACLPGNPIMLNCINDIVENVRNRFYGTNYLEPTGPFLLAKYFTQHEKEALDMKHTLLNGENRFIHLDNHIVFKNYSGYIREHNKYKKILHYAELWKRKQIYR